jgi:hypothetical protein
MGTTGTTGTPSGDLERERERPAREPWKQQYRQYQLQAAAVSTAVASEMDGGSLHAGNKEMKK